MAFDEGFERVQRLRAEGIDIVQRLVACALDDGQFDLARAGSRSRSASLLTSAPPSVAGSSVPPRQWIGRSCGICDRGFMAGVVANEREDVLGIETVGVQPQSGSRI